MVQINFHKREVNIKIVYYGPGLAGKRTNIEAVHGKVPGRKGELTQIETDGDRTVFFEFVPLDLGKVGGMETRLGLYTVPGQVRHDATWKLALQGADGIVFVVDSQAERLQENLDSLEKLEVQLREQGLDIRKVPLVFQWNKRDLPAALPVADLEQKLNPHGFPTFDASAVTGEGVFPTLKKLSQMVLDGLNEQYGMGSPKKLPAPAGAPTAPGAPALGAAEAESFELIEDETDDLPAPSAHPRSTGFAMPAPTAPAAARAFEPPPPAAKPAAKGGRPPPGQPHGAARSEPTTLQRHATVWYYRQMNPYAHFPLLVRIGAEETKKKLEYLEGGDQVSGKGPFEVRSDVPFATIVPVFSGCLVTPPFMVVDARQPSIMLQFGITPIATGTMADGRVEVWHRGRKVNEVKTPFVIAHQRVARLSAACGVAMPLVTKIGEWGGLDMESRIRAAFPSLVRAFGVWGLLLLLLAVFTGLAVTFYFWNRPREAAPASGAFTA